MYHPYGKHGQRSRRSTRGGGHEILGESPNRDRDSDESPSPERSREPGELK